MGRELVVSAPRYWLLYFQPNPESGERIVAAIITQDSDRVSVHYDESLSKPRRLDPSLDRELLKFYLDRLREDLNSQAPIEQVIGAYGPQLIASGPRLMSKLDSADVVSMLKKKFVGSPTRVSRKGRGVWASSKHVADFVLAQTPPLTAQEYRRRAKPEFILGEKSPWTRPVAVAVRQTSGWMLIDGIDLNVLKPQDARKRADEIAQNYWHYQRLAGEQKIRGIGIVLNGNSHLSSDSRDAHDYALDRFRSGADLAIDAHLSTEAERLKRALIEELPNSQ